MILTLNDCIMLSSHEGIALLERTTELFHSFHVQKSSAPGAHILPLTNILRKQFPHYPPNIYASAIEVVLARMKAEPYGAWTAHGLFTRHSVEQATNPFVARHHATAFAHCHHVLEICTGAGFDSVELARVCTHVTSIEADPATAYMARHNFAVQGISNITVLEGLAEHILPTLDYTQFDGLWSDPARRTAEGKRIFDTSQYQPPLPIIMRIPVKGVHGIKISPAVTMTDQQCISEHRRYTRAWTAVHDECREQVLWSSEDRQDLDGMIVLHDTDRAQTTLFEPPTTAIPVQIALPPADSPFILIEPHSALIRSGRLADWYASSALHLFDKHIAYGWHSLPDQCSLPAMLYSAFAVHTAFPYHKKTLQGHLDRLQWNTRTEIKKRGFPEEPEILRKQLRLMPPSVSSDFGTIILTRIGNTHWCFLAQRC